MFPRTIFAPIILLVVACSGGSNGASSVDAAPEFADARIYADANTEILCSADLRYVLDGNGAIVEECPEDQGCAGGECIPACEAAAASGGNIGCEFQAAAPHFYTGYQSPCFAVFVTNTWPTPAQLTITRSGQAFDLSGFGRIATKGMPESSWPSIPADGLPAGEVGVLFLSHNGSFNCPVTPALTGNEVAVLNSGMGAAWTIASSVPVSAYDILPYGGASSYLPSAQLLFPTSAWGDNFIAVQPMPSNGFGGGPGWAQIVASEDNTTVELVPKVTLPAAGSIPGTPAGTPVSFTLNAGEYVQWQLSNAANDNDLTGSVIASDKPVTFIGGDTYICYRSATSNGGGCDSAHQQVPPIAAFGSDYVAAPFPSRGTAPESLWYRVVAAADGTILTYDPPIAGAPTSLAQGQFVDFETTMPFRVESQDPDHAFYVAQVMPGCTFDGNDGCMGDEDYLIVLPSAQYLKRYVFFTDPSYDTTQMVFVRKKVGGNFADVSLECLGTVTGWTPVGTSGEFEMAQVTTVAGGVPVGACANGRHEASSEAPFGLTVWGTSWAASYSYPAGGNVSTINEIVIDPID